MMNDLMERIAKLKELDDKVNNRGVGLLAFLEWRLAWHERSIYFRDNARKIIEELETYMSDDLAWALEKRDNCESRLKKLESQNEYVRKEITQAIEEMPHSNRKSTDILKDLLETWRRR